MIKYKTTPDKEPTVPTLYKNQAPGCIYVPADVQCYPDERHCETCGWNPEVAAARLKKLHPNYQPNGNQESPDNG